MRCFEYSTIVVCAIQIVKEIDFRLVFVRILSYLKSVTQIRYINVEDAGRKRKKSGQRMLMNRD